MAKKPTERDALNILKHLPAYPVIWGMNKGKMAKAMLRFFLTPAEDDMSRKAHSKRAFISGYRLDELSRAPTTINNMEPFCSMVQMGMTFDRMLEFSVGLRIDPFTVLPLHVEGLSGKGGKSVFGKWMGGLGSPFPHIQHGIDHFFLSKLGTGHHVFMQTPDWLLIQLGYLTDSRPKREHQNWRGDREKVGGDPYLVLTNLAAGWPLYIHTEKSKAGTVKVRWFKDQPQYQIDLDMDTKKYVRKSYHFGRVRYERLKYARQMARHLEIIEKRRQQIRAIPF